MRIRVSALILFLAAASWGAPAHVQSKWCSNSSGATGTCAFTSNVVQGDLIVVGCGGSRNAGVAYTVTDNWNNTYTLISGTTTLASGTAAAGVWYAYNVVAGSNTVTCRDANGVSTWIQHSIHEYSAASTATDPLDVYSSSAPATTESVTQMVTSSATTSGSSELMFSYCNFGLGTVTSQSGTLRTNSVDNAYMASQDTVIAAAGTLYQSYFNSAANNRSYVCIQAAFRSPAPPTGYHRWE